MSPEARGACELNRETEVKTGSFNGAEQILHNYGDMDNENIKVRS